MSRPRMLPLSAPSLITLLLLSAQTSLSAAQASVPPYEKRAAERMVPTADVQFAILHALLNWQGGSSPSYADYEVKDRGLLAGLGIQVKPLEDAAERVILDDELAKIRRSRNLGVPSVNNLKKPISFEVMVRRHKALITGYASRLTYVKPDDTAPLPDLTAVRLSRRQDMVLDLAEPLKAMSKARSDDDFAAAVERFNAAAAVFGKGYRVSLRPGKRRREEYAKALKIYESERKEAFKAAP